MRLGVEIWEAAPFSTGSLMQERRRSLWMPIRRSSDSRHINFIIFTGFLGEIYARDFPLMRSHAAARCSPSPRPTIGHGTRTCRVRSRGIHSIDHDQILGELS